MVIKCSQLSHLKKFKNKSQKIALKRVKKTDRTVQYFDYL
jgi:hypothetical protein